MTDIDKLNEIYGQYSDRFVSGFHNMLWQVMINESLSDSPAEHAFHVLHNGVMVIAASDGGYLQGCQCRIIDGATFENGHDAAQVLAAVLSHLVFDHGPEARERIIIKSMRG